uniref:Protein tweety homolog n=1 Tax=Romanomermis culicivorax TaxID=13658 RepID=A0A915HJB6_ROMCU
ARKLLETSVEQVPAIISGVSCLLGQNAGETSLSVVQILVVCQRVQQNFYEVLKNLGSINDLLDNNLNDVQLQILNKNVCNFAVLSTAATLLLLVVFALLLFIVLSLLKRAYFCLLDDHQFKICYRGAANGHRRYASSSATVDDVGAEHLAACSSLYERGEPFFGNVIGDAERIPAEFYGTHVSNPRTRQQNGRIEGNAERGVTNQSQIFRPSPPPAYEHVPLLHTQRFRTVIIDELQ